MSKFNTFQDILAANGISEETFNSQNEGLSPDEVGYRKIKQIVIAYNGNSDKRTTGYYPWFTKTASGSGVSFCASDSDYSATVVASRLYFDRWQDADEAGETFEAEYAEWLLA